MSGSPRYDEIDELLYEWYRWTNGFTEVIGYSGADPTCRDFRTSRQYMDDEHWSDTVDYQIRKFKAKAVDPIVSALGLSHRIAINVEMRNMECGNSVFRNPRNPESQAADYREAKRIMFPKLCSAGLVNPEKLV